MTFVLIHSTGQAAAGWDRVVEALARRDRAAVAVELPSDDKLQAADYAEIVRRQARGLERPVAVAHSGSGPLLPAVVRAVGARHQVWLAAWVPKPDAGFLEEVSTNAEEAFEPGWIGKDPIEDRDAAVHFLYHDCDGEALEWALTTRRLFLPRAVYEERVELAGEVPSTYIVAARDRTIRPEWQRRMARERLHVEPLEIDSGHCPNVSRPGELADLLAQID